MPVIEISGITKSYGPIRALVDVTFSVGKGEIFGLIGPDGSGKTSLFRILTTLLKPDSGHASIMDLDIIRDFKQVRKIIGYMPGRFSLYQDLTVEENLSFYATVFGTTIEKNYDLIKEIYQHIEPFKTRRAGRLSGGMKQKLALSCALIHSPDVLILDEPTTGVDAVSRKEFWEMLMNLKQHGITIIVSTPYMDEAALCQRVGLIQNGRMLIVDTPDFIIDQFREELFAVKSDEMYRLVRDLQLFKKIKTTFLFGQNIHVTMTETENPEDEITDYLNKLGHKQVEIKHIIPGIEDCFMELMTKNIE
ncbi:MAG: ATPase [Bacteroides sp. SM23_62_1]|nr:MAG: ATPase [Bacteroides sp. SM23_62_1]